MLQGPKGDFAFISEADEFEAQRFSDWYLSSVETLYQDKDAWNPDTQRIGDLTLEVRNTADTTRVSLRADIDLDNGESVTLEGRGELVDGILRRGRLVEVVGTGKFKHRHRVIWLRVRNPKRWGFDDVP